MAKNLTTVLSVSFGILLLSFLIYLSLVFITHCNRNINIEIEKLEKYKEIFLNDKNYRGRIERTRSNPTRCESKVYDQLGIFIFGIDESMKEEVTLKKILSNVCRYINDEILKNQCSDVSIFNYDIESCFVEVSNVHQKLEYDAFGQVRYKYVTEQNNKEEFFLSFGVVNNNTSIHNRSDVAKKIKERIIKTIDEKLEALMDKKGIEGSSFSLSVIFETIYSKEKRSY
jgi:hypothetical protein